MRSRRKNWYRHLCQPKLWIMLFGLVSLGVLAGLSFCRTPSRRTGLPTTVVLDWLNLAPSIEPDEGNVVSKKFEFVIQVLAYDRYDSLRRCLRSLAIADYGGDVVNLVVHLDHFKPEERNPANRRLLRSESAAAAPESGIENRTVVGVINMQDEAEIKPEEIEFSSDPVERKLQQADRVLKFLDRFSWPHGSKQVHYRTLNVGLQVQWIEAWWPSSDHQFALVVEDDMQLSPLFYRYIRSIIARYYYDPANFDSSVFGISLQRPRLVPGKGGNRIAVDNSTRLFLYQLVGTWGQILFPKPWKEFRQWYEDRKARGIEPVIDGMITTGWYKRLGTKIWTPWFLKFAHSRGYFNFYTNFLDERALSISHRTQGVNYHKDAGPDSKLINRTGTTDIDLWEMPALSTLKWYDYCFHEVVRNRIVKGSRDLEELLSRVHSDRQVVLVNTVGVDEGIVRNWLCRLAALGTKNYVLIASSYNSSIDLARRGHPVLLPDEELEGNSSDGAIYSIKAMRRVLAMEYDGWLVRPDSVWLRQPLNPSSDGEDLLVVLVGKSFHSGLFFARSSGKSQILLKTVEMSLLDRERKLSVGSALWSGVASTGGIKVGAPPESVVSRNWTSIPHGARARVLLRPEGSIEEAERTKLVLEAAGLWIVDDELACKQVICKPRL